MEKRVLGRTGIEVSEISLGCEGFEGKPYEECEPILDAAFSAGVNFIDVYSSNPMLRSNLGRALARYPRESFVIEGHLCSTWEKGQYVRTRNIDKARPAFEDLLERMQLDYVDVGMIHYCDAQEDFDRVFNGPIIEFAKELKAQGKICCIGLSTHNPAIGLAAVQTGNVDVILFSVNAAYDMIAPSENVNILFDKGTFKGAGWKLDPVRERFYQACEREGVAITVMKTFAGSMLLDGRRSPLGVAMTPVQCIHYVLTRPGVSAAMLGVGSIGEVDDALAYVTASESEKDFSQALSQASAESAMGRCTYCGHCAPCTAGINIAAVGKYLDLAQAEGVVPETVLDHYRLLDRHAGECTQCGACEKRCPFGVHIIERMGQAAELFGN